MSREVSYLRKLLMYHVLGSRALRISKFLTQETSWLEVFYEVKLLEKFFMLEIYQRLRDWANDCHSVFHVPRPYFACNGGSM
jgi:hypothetical protein